MGDCFLNILQTDFKRFSSELKVSQDFIVEIYHEQNSWNFISKFAQFTEAVFTKILVQRLNEKDTYNTISNLPQSVRLNLAYDLNLISKEQKLLFLTIAEIRNDYIHNISNIDVGISDYLKNLKVDRLKEIYKRFKPFINDKEITSHEHFREKCRTGIIFTACCLEIQTINAKVDGYTAEQDHADRRAKYAVSLLPKKNDDALFIEDHQMVSDYVIEAKKALKKYGLLIPKFPPK